MSYFSNSVSLCFGFFVGVWGFLLTHTSECTQTTHLWLLLTQPTFLSKGNLSNKTFAYLAFQLELVKKLCILCTMSAKPRN